MYTRKDKINSILALIGFLVVWEIIDYVLNIKEIILPNPHEIFFALTNNFSNLMNNALITGFEAMTGFLLGSAISIIVAIIFTYNKSIKKLVYPYTIVIMAVPTLVLAPLLVLWLGNGLISKIALSALIAFFPVLVGAVKGFSAIGREEIDLFRSFSASEKQIFFKLRLPQSLKHLFPAFKVSITLAVTAAVVAEFTGASKGIGHLIMNASYYLETSLVFAGIIIISLVGIVFFYIVDFIEKKIVFWEN